MAQESTEREEDVMDAEMLLDSLFVVQDVPSGIYAMWWSNDDEPSFMNSDTRGWITAAYHHSDGIESYVAAHLLRQLGILGHEQFRAALPEEPARVFLNGPDGQVLVLSLSSEKGIRFHFPVAKTPLEFRERLWMELAHLAAAMKGVVRKEGLPTDDLRKQETPGPPSGWWRLVDATFCAQSGKGLGSDCIGMIVID